MLLELAYLSHTLYSHSKIPFWSWIWCSGLLPSCQSLPTGFHHVPSDNSGSPWHPLVLVPSFAVSIQKDFLWDCIVSPLPNPKLEGQWITLCLTSTLWPVWHGWPSQDLSSHRLFYAGHWGTQAPWPRQGSDPPGSADCAVVLLIVKGWLRWVKKETWSQSGRCLICKQLELYPRISNMNWLIE